MTAFWPRNEGQAFAFGGGKISFKLGELTKADDYLEKLHALVPDFPEASSC